MLGNTAPIDRSFAPHFLVLLLTCSPVSPPGESLQPPLLRSQHSTHITTPSITNPGITHPNITHPDTPQPSGTSAALDKITFDLAQISPDGLIGSEGSLRSLSYEFCIPATATHLAEVEAIDPSVQHFQHSRGRIGCTIEQYLCIGNTHQTGWREALMQLAQLDYIERIDEFLGE